MCIEKQYMQSTKSSIWMSLALEEKKKKKKEKLPLDPLSSQHGHKDWFPLMAKKRKNTHKSVK